MKRYIFRSINVAAKVHEDPDGEWVRWEDVEKFINALKAAFTIQEILGVIFKALEDQKDIFELLKLYADIKGEGG